MKNQKYIWIAAILIAVLTMWLLSRPKVPLPQSISTSKAEPTNSTSANSLIVKKIVFAPTPTKTNSAALIDVENKYRAGEISKGQAIQTELEQENKKPLDIYGKIIDQYGEPVVGAKVEGSILLNISFTSSGSERHFTETDSEGRFNFVGINGVGIGIRPTKEGYFYNTKLPSQRPKDYTPDPNNPLVFVMWKIHGAEHLVNVSFASDIPSDGTPVTFDIVTQRKNPNGDLQATLLRSPANVKRSGQKFDWTLEVEMLHGGLLPENDPYPYWAADSGYKSVFTLNMSSNVVPWRSTTKQDFYIRSSHGQYGRMEVTVYSAVTPARIKFDLTVNPSGSQNLEPNFSTQ